MKKIVYLSLILLTLVGCNKNLTSDNKIEDKKDEVVVENNEIIPEEVYIDDNPIKIAFYQGNNGTYKRVDSFISHVEEYKEIGIFSIILSNEEEVNGSSIKSLYKEKSESIENFNNYKIGFNIKFTLEDGTVINENILRPLDYESYGFSPYLFAWIYDDVNANGWHAHIEENEFNDNTIMSSIKLMWGPSSNQINSNIELTVFTYDSDDFDEFNNYRGISKWTTIIERE